MHGATRHFAFEVRSRLAAPADRVWAHATSMRGVNSELFPLVRMTHPLGSGRFLERSPMLSQREWEHERKVEPRPGIAALAPLFRAVFLLAFRLRHRNLRRRFGILPP